MRRVWIGLGLVVLRGKRGERGEDPIRFTSFGTTTLWVLHRKPGGGGFAGNASRGICSGPGKIAA